MAEKILIANIKGPKGEPGQGLPIGGNTGNVLIKKSNDDLDYDWLDLDASADFLIENGFGKLRYYNNKFQYYDNDTSSWIDTIPTLDNSFIIKITPNSVSKFVTACNPETLNIEIKLEEPRDTIVDSQVFCILERVIVRRKKDSFPTDENDGDHVFTVNRNEFGKYKDKPFIDVVNGDIDDVYYYKAFPVSNNGIVSYREDNNRKCKIKDYQIYGFRIDQNESDPEIMVQYLDDVDNTYFSPAHMNYEKDVFDYGDWGESWFIKKLKPCMLKYDGTVAYELDKNDYSKKVDGSPSDITDDTFEGNVMVGFPKIYWKIIENGNDTADVFFSDRKLDDDYVCWCNINELGEEIDYFYYCAYNSSYTNPRMRSLSGKTMNGNYTYATAFTRAKANNITGQNAWHIELFIDRVLINLLLTLIGKSTDSQTVFGMGNSSNASALTGVLDKKGLFYGKTTPHNIKVFGIENYWGNQLRYAAGVISGNGVVKLKLTHSTLDGSTVEGYNGNGSGYKSISGLSTSAGYISKMKFTDNIMFPSETKASVTTKYCDNYAIQTDNRLAYCGGAGTSTLGSTGAFYIGFNCSSASAAAGISSGLSCKPLNTTPQEV